MCSKVIYNILFLLLGIPSGRSFTVVRHGSLSSRRKIPTSSDFFRSSLADSTTTTYQSLEWKRHAKNERNDLETTNDKVYNDDAFGLVFLCGLFVAKDIVFCGIFLLASTIALISTRLGWISFTNPLPGLVAGFSLGLAYLANETLERLSILGPTEMFDKDASALAIEVAVCTVSIVYSYFLRKNSNDS